MILLLMVLTKIKLNSLRLKVIIFGGKLIIIHFNFLN